MAFGVERVSNLDKSKGEGSDLPGHARRRSASPNTSHHEKPTTHSGLGKTILAFLIIDRLRISMGQGTSAITYIYCDYTRQSAQDSRNLIGSLLRQILQQQTSISENVKSSYQTHKREGTSLNKSQLFELLESTVAKFASVYIILDASDELTTSDDRRQELLKRLQYLQVNCQLSLLTTSRPSVDLSLDFDSPLRLEIRANDDDVRSYAHAYLMGLAKNIQNHEDLRKSVIETVVKASGGM